MKVAVLACVAACAAPKTPTSTDEVATLRTAFVAAVDARQLDAVMAMYTLDAVYLPQTGNRVVSKLAIHNMYAKIWERFTPHLELTSKYAERFGQLAYETGEYTESISAAEGSLALSGSYIFIYRREKDGWHFASQAFTEQRPGN